MEIIIVGAGVVGISLARYLSGEGHNVVVVDNNAAVIRQLQESMDLQALHGDTTDGAFLRGVGLERAGLVLAVTNSDETNIIITLVAQAINPSARIIARVCKKQFLDNPAITETNKIGGVTFFSPDHAAVEMVQDLLLVDQSFEVVPFEHGAISVAGFRLGADSVLVGRPLHTIRELADLGVLIVALDRGGQVNIPNGQTVLNAADRVYVSTGSKTELSKIIALLGMPTVEHRKIVIAGGGWKGGQIATRLEQGRVPVLLLERSLDRCQELAAALDNVTVLHCDATDPGTIRKVSQGTSTFIAMTGQQEVNLVLCLLARQYGALRTIAMMDNEAYVVMAHSLGIDAVVSPKQASVGKVLRFLSTGKVLDSATMLHGRLDALLVEIQANSRMVGKPLREIGLPRTLIVAAAIKQGQILIPTGSMTLQPGDLVLLITFPGYFQRVDEFLSGR
ncbi:MAG: Trk system potassium transporter TrkA [Magnetococcus sp. DMHC-8]